MKKKRYIQPQTILIACQLSAAFMDWISIQAGKNPQTGEPTINAKKNGIPYFLDEDTIEKTIWPN